MPIHQPYHSSMKKEIAKAASIVNSFFDSSVSPDKEVPADIIASCAGIAFLTVVKAGFIWTGKIGTGVVLARLADGSWSAPSGLGTGGVGFGFEVGAEVVDFMIILGSESAVKAFKKGTQISVGVGLDLAIGPVGRTGAANINAGGSGLSANFIYSRAKGLFAGIGLHGSTFLVRGDVNKKFYGREVSPMEILSGSVTPPPGSCDALYHALQRASSFSPSVAAAPPTRHSSNTIINRSSMTSASGGSSGGGSSGGGRSSLGSLPSSERSSNVERKSDPRLKKYSGYKSEKDLYAEFQSRKSSTEIVDSKPGGTSAQSRSQQLPQPADPSEKQAVFANIMLMMQDQAPSADLQTFKDNCRLFGQDQLPLGVYFGYLRSIGSPAFLSQLVPQLVRLLPTEKKRQDIWHLYTTQIVPLL